MAGGMVQSYGYPGAAAGSAGTTSQIVSRAVAAAAANNHHSGRKGGRTSKRYSVSAFYSMAAEQDNEVEDELAQGKYILSAPAENINRVLMSCIHNSPATSS